MHLRPLVVLALALAAFLLPHASATPPAPPGVINVPTDYPTIQQAISASVGGDTILVAPGTYYENIDFLGKDIVVQSTGGPWTTTIDGSGLDSVVKFWNGESALACLDGFTVANGFGNPGYCGCTSIGGGLLISERGGVPSSPTIRNCLIVGNVAINGAGVHSSHSAPSFINCVVAGNTASGVGGGLWLVNPDPSGAQPSLTGCTVAFNAGGDGIYVDRSATALVTNCVLWGNTPAQVTGTATVTYSDVQGGWAGSGNIDADPLFLDPGNLDLHLTAASPCFNTGSNAAPGLPPVDFEGDPRIIAGTVDMGADEYLGPPAVSSVAPWRSRYDESTACTVVGSGFSLDPQPTVLFGTSQATSVVVVDDSTITCDTPITAQPGPVDVMVTNSIGSGTLQDGFTYTPAVQITGNAVPGGTITLTYLCDPGDGILSIYGLPPQLSIPTPPYAGELAIWPFYRLFLVQSWPFDTWSQNFTIPPDPSLSGVQVLFQGLIGPSFGVPKDAAWTNVRVLDIQ